MGGEYHFSTRQNGLISGPQYLFLLYPTADENPSINQSSSIPNQTIRLAAAATRTTPTTAMSSSLFRILPSPSKFYSSLSPKNNPLRFYSSLTSAPAPAAYTHRSKEDLYEAEEARHRQISENRNLLDHKRRLLAAKYELRRKLYKALCKDPNLPSEMREKHRYKLSKLPRNSSFTRVRNRCISSGRPRSVYETFRFSRIVFRDLASRGLLMGVKKASW